MRDKDFFNKMKILMVSLVLVLLFSAMSYAQEESPGDDSGASESGSGQGGDDPGAGSDSGDPASSEDSSSDGGSEHENSGDQPESNQDYAESTDDGESEASDPAESEDGEDDSQDEDDSSSDEQNSDSGEGDPDQDDGNEDSSSGQDGGDDNGSYQDNGQDDGQDDAQDSGSDDGDNQRGSNQDDEDDSRENGGSDQDEDDEDYQGDPCDMKNCNDYDPCTADYCVDGDCKHHPIGNCNVDLCLNKDCGDDDNCTKDVCLKGECFNIPLEGCGLEEEGGGEEGYTIDKVKLRPEDAKYVILNEFPGDSFGIETEKQEYQKDEGVWTKINAPEGSDVELSLSYDGFNQFIKIPEEKGYPLDYELPLPRNIKEGIYVVRAAIYYAGLILKTNTYFKISEDDGKISFEETNQEQEVQIQSGSDDSSEDNKDDDIEENRNIDGQEDIGALGADDKIGSKEVSKGEGPEKKKAAIKVGEPVRWKKKVKVENPNDEDSEIELIVNIPQKSGKVKVIESQSKSQVAADKKGADLVIKDGLEAKNKKEYVVEFETNAPTKIEDNPVIEGNKWKKRVVIASDEEYHGEYEYKDVLSYASIEEAEKDDIRLYWNIKGEKVDITNYESFDLSYYDTNSNGKVDKISWITPHLSEQEFEIVITITATASQFEPNIDVLLTAPSQGSHFKKSPVAFWFTVNYNSSLTNVRCNLSIDDNFVDTDIDASTNQYSKNINLSEGRHEWYVSCFSSETGSYESDKRSFIVDLSAPEIELLNDNPDLSLVDYIGLNFTADDNFASYMDCDLLVDGYARETMTINTGDVISRELTEMQNGSYEWSVSCEDIAGNVGTSNTSEFFIDTKRNFSITTNKESYTLGEGGIIIVTAPYESEVTLLITTPIETSLTRTYDGAFPVIDDFDFANYPGTYKLEAFLNYNGAVRKSTYSFNVENTMAVSIKASRDKITPGGSIDFSASSSGGIGDVSYGWDFDDGTANSGRSVSKSFGEKGTYDVTVRASDSKGNSVEASIRVSVEDQYKLEIIAIDSKSKSAIKDAKVNMEGEEKKTGSGGKVQYTLFRGDYSFYISKEGYRTYYNYTTLVDDDSMLAQMEENNVSPKNITDFLVEKIEEPAQVRPEEGEGQEEQIPAEQQDSGLINQIDRAIENLDNIPTDNKKLALILDIEGQLEQAKTNVERSDRDMFNLNENNLDLSAEEIEKRKEEIRSEIEQLKESTIKSVKLNQEEEFRSFPVKEDIEKLASSYIQENNLTLEKGMQKDYEERIESLQEGVEVISNIRQASVEYLSGEKGDITLVTMAIDSGDDITGTKAVSFIDKDVADDVDDMIFLTGHKVINPDPIVEFDMAVSNEISYYIKGSKDIDSIKEIKTVLFKDPEELELKRPNKGFSITGFAIFSSIGEIDDPILFVEIILIAVLLMLYLIYQFDLIERTKRLLLMRDKNLQEIKGFIKDMRNALENKETGNAEVIYKDIMKAYKDLPKKAKAKIHKDTKTLHSEILFAKLNQSIDDTLEHIKEKKISDAKGKYKKIKDIYSMLPKDYKTRAKGRCSLVFDKLTVTEK